MSGWDPRGHRTAQQRAREQDPITRKLNKAAQLAPSIPLPPTRCTNESNTGLCNDPELGHRDGGPCIRVGCGCTEYRRPT